MVATNSIVAVPIQIATQDAAVAWNSNSVKTLMNVIQVLITATFTQPVPTQKDPITALATQDLKVMALTVLTSMSVRQVPIIVMQMQPVLTQKDLMFALATLVLRVMALTALTSMSVRQMPITVM